MLSKFVWESDIPCLERVKFLEVIRLPCFLTKLSQFPTQPPTVVGKIEAQLKYKLITTICTTLSWCLLAKSSAYIRARSEVY